MNACGCGDGYERRGRGSVERVGQPRWIVRIHRWQTPNATVCRPARMLIPERYPRRRRMYRHYQRCRRRIRCAAHHIIHNAAEVHLLALPDAPNERIDITDFLARGWPHLLLVEHRSRLGRTGPKQRGRRGHRGMVTRRLSRVNKREWTGCIAVCLHLEGAVRGGCGVVIEAFAF